MADGFSYNGGDDRREKEESYRSLVIFPGKDIRRRSPTNLLRTKIIERRHKEGQCGIDGYNPSKRAGIVKICYENHRIRDSLKRSAHRLPEAIAQVSRSPLFDTDQTSETGAPWSLFGRIELSIIECFIYECNDSEKTEASLDSVYPEGPAP